MEKTAYDLIIIGGGQGALACAYFKKKRY